MCILLMLWCLSVTTAVVVTGLPLEPQQLNGLPTGYRLVPMMWMGVIEAGEENMSFEGTIQEVIAEVQRLKPDFSWQTAFGSQDNGLVLRNRDVEDDNQLICNVGGGGKVPMSDGWTAAIDLSRKSTTYALGPGPRTCSQASCEKSVGIWLCNDQQEAIVMSSWTVANYAGEILTRCADSSQLIQGQVFDSNDHYEQQGIHNQYNVLLGKWDC
ncbi:hypothetical protein HD806DRAFT_32528 [Xylariaceae sp. AK1471]|nr:hypothetical protein HD806DRAFT_32528 [Xylariaceae sp. AK1471]